VPPDQAARLRAELAQTPNDAWCGLVCCVIPPPVKAKTGGTGALKIPY